MCGHNKQDFPDLNYTMISLMSNKINILIVGGGEAAFIKCRTFSREGCNITVVSKAFSHLFESLKASNIKLIKSKYDKSFIEHNHIVIIATDNEETNNAIKEDCDKISKLYIHCADFKEGLIVIPVQKDTPNMKLALHTKNSSPKTALFMSTVIEDKLLEYNEFIDYTSSIRNMLKKVERKKEIMSFICSEDFYFFYNKGVQNIILEMFYGIEIGIVES